MPDNNLKDKLKEFFILQENLMLRYKARDKNFPKWPVDISNKANQKFIRDVLFNAIEELAEAVSELKNRKAHRQTEISEFDKQKFLVECVDAQKFILEALILLGISADEFHSAYLNKDALCHYRLNEGY